MIHGLVGKVGRPDIPIFCFADILSKARKSILFGVIFEACASFDGCEGSDVSKIPDASYELCVFERWCTESIGRAPVKVIGLSVVVCPGLVQ